MYANSCGALCEQTSIGVFFSFFFFLSFLSFSTPYTGVDLICEDNATRLGDIVVLTNI